MQDHSSSAKQVQICRSPEAFSIYRRKLPHWRMGDSIYFLTWRLHQRQMTLEPVERRLVVDALRHFEGIRYSLHAYAVMDDHVHVIVEPASGQNLSGILHSWKSFTAHEIQRQRKRQGVVWQAESFDRIIRDETEYDEKAQYISKNPFKRWPDLLEYEWMGFPQWEKAGMG